MGIFQRDLPIAPRKEIHSAYWSFRVATVSTGPNHSAALAEATPTQRLDHGSCPFYDICDSYCQIQVLCKPTKAETTQAQNSIFNSLLQSANFEFPSTGSHISMRLPLFYSFAYLILHLQYRPPVQKPIHAREPEVYKSMYDCKFWMPCNSPQSGIPT